MGQQAEHWDFGVLTSREEWDDTAGIYTLLNGDGKVMESRPFTAEETAFYAEQAQGLAANEERAQAQAALVVKLKTAGASPAEQQSAIAQILGG